jgi:hypothetical protein
LGTPLETATFAAGTINDTVGPLANALGSPLTADAEEYAITFTARQRSANDTIQLVTDPGAPEPSTWAMMLLGLAGLGFAGYRQAKARRARVAA